MSAILRHIEMVLNLMSLPVIWLVHFFVSPHFQNPWKFTALAALTVAILHGTLGWLVRNRQRQVREQVLGRVYAVLTGTEHLDSVSELQQRLRLAVAQLPVLRREPMAWVPEGDPRILSTQEIGLISSESRATAIAIGGLLAVLACAKLALWPLLLRRRSTVRYRRITRGK